MPLIPTFGRWNSSFASLGSNGDRDIINKDENISKWVWQKFLHFRKLWKYFMIVSEKLKINPHLEAWPLDTEKIVHILNSNYYYTLLQRNIKERELCELETTVQSVLSPLKQSSAWQLYIFTHTHTKKWQWEENEVTVQGEHRRVNEEMCYYLVWFACRVSLCSTNWPRNYCLDQTSLKLSEIQGLSSQVLKLKVCPTMPNTSRCWYSQCYSVFLWGPVNSALLFSILSAKPSINWVSVSCYLGGMADCSVGKGAWLLMM